MQLESVLDPGNGAGAHVVLWPRKRIAEEAAVEAAASRGVGNYGTARYFLKRPSRPRSCETYLAARVPSVFRLSTESAPFVL